MKAHNILKDTFENGCDMFGDLKKNESSNFILLDAFERAKEQPASFASYHPLLPA
jgi:hypothetical protein